MAEYQLRRTDSNGRLSAEEDKHQWQTHLEEDRHQCRLSAEEDRH